MQHEQKHFGKLRASIRLNRKARVGKKGTFRSKEMQIL